MILEALVEFDAPFGGGANQVYSPARRFGLQPQRPVRGALIQTETAMDALVEFGQIERCNPGLVCASLLIAGLDQLSTLFVSGLAFPLPSSSPARRGGGKRRGARRPLWVDSNFRLFHFRAAVPR